MEETHWPSRYKDAVKRDIDIDTESFKSLADDNSKLERDPEKTSEVRGREACEYYSNRARRKESSN